MARQQSFDFPDETKPPTTEPTRPARVTPQGTSICHYCGERMPASQDREPRLTYPRRLSGTQADGA
jgi:hypothetical protein